MKLYTVRIRHCGPKDCKESIIGYFVAENDSAIMNYIDKELLGGIWKDRNDEDGLCEILDENYNVIGTETYSEKMIRIRGEFNNSDADYSEAYYGITHYGWDEGKHISDEEVNVLVNLGVAKYLQ